MGNQEHKSCYIHEFLENFTGKKLNDISDDKKIESLAELLAQFDKNRNLYKLFKTIEREKDVNYDLNDGRNEDKADKKDDEELILPIKCTEFLNLLISFAEGEYYTENLDILITVIKLMKIMVYEAEFYKLYRSKIIDKFLKRLDDNDNSHEKQIELKLKIYELIYETMNYICQNKTSLKVHLSVLTKIYNVPKRNTDKLKNKAANFKLQKYKIINKLFEILKFISEEKENKMSRLINENEELLKTILYDYNLNNVYRDMLADIEIKQSSANEEIKKLIISSYTNLSYIDYIISNKYLTEEVIDKLAKFITMDSISTSVPEMIKNPLKFLINFYIKSFDLEIFDNFKIFADEQSDHLKSIFSLISELSSLENLQASEDNSHITFLISCFFITISLKSSVYEKINEKNIIKPSCDCIKKFIYDTFNKERFPDGNIPLDIASEKQKDLEKLRAEEKKKRTILKNRFNLIKILGKILGFIAKENVYKKIYHIEYFKYLFNFVVDLFHIDYTDINTDIYSIFNVCTYFTDCKYYLFLENKDNFKIIRDDLFSRIKITLNNYNIIKNTYLNNESIKNSSKNKKEDMDHEDIKSAVEEKLKLFENINIKNKIFAIANFNDFTLLCSILCNLVIINDYVVFKHLLLENLEIDFEEFKKQLESFVEDFESKANLKNRIVTFEKFIHPAKLFLMLIDPMVKFTGGKMQVINDSNEKSRYHDIIREYKLILDSTSNDDDAHHKILFIIYRFLSKCINLKEISEIIDSIITSANNNIYKIGSNIIVNREWLRLLYSLLQFSESTLFWLKCDSNKVYIDYANNCDVVVRYKDERDIMNKKVNFNLQSMNSGGKMLVEKAQNNDKENKDEIINLPFHKVKTFNEMGIIMFTTHHLLIPKVLRLGKSYTIFFRFYYPIINTDNDHVLLQDCTKIPIISITKNRKNLVAFSTSGEMINSGINLEQRNLQGWLNACLSYSESKNHRKVTFFFQNSQMNSYEKESYQLPNNVAYIGNGKDFDTPFGAFCDLRIYSGAVDINGYRQIAKINDEEKNANKNNGEGGSSSVSFLNRINNSIMPKILQNFLDPISQGNPLKCNDFDNTEESFYFFIKVLNAILINKENRNGYIKYDLIFKIMEFLCSKSFEIKKDIAKFLNTIA